MTASEFLRWIDLITERSLANSPFKHCCAKGCHHCCDEQLYVERREAVHIVEGLSPEEKERIIPRLKVWLEKTAAMRAGPVLESTGMPDAFDFRDLKATCPLLEDGLCMVYERRPMSCRQFFALGNPDDCRMPMRRHQKFAEFDPKANAYTMLFEEWVVKNRVPKLITDMLGVFLAELLLGQDLPSTGRTNYEIEYEDVLEKV